MRRLSESERAEIWDRFESGESLRSISRQLGRAPSSVRTHVVAAGWRRPVPGGDWCALRLSFREREEISRGIAAGVSLRCIARRLGRSPSTVSREVAVNGGRLRYRAAVAHRASRRRAHRPKPAKLACNPQLRQVVEAKLGLWWSPLQISRWLMEAYPGDKALRALGLPLRGDELGASGRLARARNGLITKIVIAIGRPRSGLSPPSSPSTLSALTPSVRFRGTGSAKGGE